MLPCLTCSKALRATQFTVVSVYKSTRALHWQRHPWCHASEPYYGRYLTFSELISDLEKSPLYYSNCAYRQNREDKRVQAAARHGLKYYQRGSLDHSIRLDAWLAAGPPPLSEYTLTFGKHRGKRLEEVPDTYLVKYLIPRSGGGGVIGTECPVVESAIDDFKERFPGVKSQAGRAKAKPLKRKGLKLPDIMTKPKKESKLKPKPTT